MAGHSGPNIVQDSLTFSIDAANIRSYEDGSNDVYNLISPSSGSLDGVDFNSNDLGKWDFSGSSTSEIIFDTGSNGNWGTDSWSVDVWFSTTESITNTAQGLIGKWAGGNYQEGWGIALRGNSYNGIMVRICSGSSQNLAGTGALRDIFPPQNITSSLSDGKGHNITVTFDTSTYTASLYVDGEYSSNNTNFDSGWSWENFITASNLRVGRSNDISGYYHGEISSVKFYRKSLSEEEVTQNYRAFKNRFI